LIIQEESNRNKTSYKQGNPVGLRKLYDLYTIIGKYEIDIRNKEDAYIGYDTKKIEADGASNVKKNLRVIKNAPANDEHEQRQKRSCCSQQQHSESAVLLSWDQPNE
jgi:hypothetical protein